jgi:hypothetical protein
MPRLSAATPTPPHRPSSANPHNPTQNKVRCYPQPGDILWITCEREVILMCVNVDDDAAPFVACFDVSEGVGGLGERIALVNDGLKLA